MASYQVADRGDLRKYRTEIPNSIDDMDLSVYAFRLYVHLKRVAGDSGTCWQSTETLATSCKMSKAMVSKVKNELVDKGLIHIDEEKLERGGRAAHHITINDIWLENFIKFAGHEPSSSDERSSSLYELPSSPHEQASSPGEIKNKPIKKEPIKNRSRKRDERTDFPAIQLVKAVTGKYPPKTIYDMIIRRLGSSPDGEKFARIHTEWVARGFNPSNISGQLEWYDNGIPQKKDYHPNGSTPKRILTGANGEKIEVDA